MIVGNADDAASGGEMRMRKANYYHCLKIWFAGAAVADAAEDLILWAYSKKTVSFYVFPPFVNRHLGD